jgi:hypothetical protein
MVSVCLFATTCDCRRLQDCKDRRGLEWNSKMEIWYIFYRNLPGPCILCWILQFILILQITRQRLTKSTGSTASFKTHGKSNHILLSKIINNGAPFDWFRCTQHTSLALPCLISCNGIILGVACLHSTLSPWHVIDAPDILLERAPCWMLQQMAVDTLQQQIHQQNCFYLSLSGVSIVTPKSLWGFYFSRSDNGAAM